MRKLLAILVLLPVLSFAQQEERAVLDSLLGRYTSRQYKKMGDNDKVAIISAIAGNYVDLKNDSAIFYAKKGLELSKDAGYRKGEGRCLEVLALADYYNYDAALKYLLSALKIFEEVNDDTAKVRVLDKIAGVYFNMEKFTPALHYFKRGLAVSEKIGDERMIATSRYRVSAAYGMLGNDSMNLQYALPAVKYFVEAGKFRQAAYAYANIASTYSKLKKYNEALLFANKAMRFVDTATKDLSYAGIVLSLGAVHYNIATDSSTVLKPDSLLSSNRKIHLQKAINCYYDVYHLYPDNPEFNVSRVLAEALEMAGNYKEASKYYRYYVNIRDSMLSRDKRVQVAELGTEREAYLKEKQIAINNIQAANKNKERVLFIAIATLLGVVVVSIRRSNRKLTTEKQKSDDLAINLQESLVQKEDLAAQLSLAADMKTRFLANISHELRTPVTLLTGMLGLMKEHQEEDAVVRDKDRLDAAYNNSRKLQFMVEEILDLSRVETTQTKLKVENRDIAPILKRMVYAFETFIEKEQLRLEYTETNVEGIHISADENMLEKIINNLVYNAIKFNDRGGWIKVRVFTSPDSKEMIFTINNTGSIIRPEDLVHIFERFYQADTTTVKAEGVGIGLSLVKEFTSLMGGTVEATSAEGTGTTFTLKFPITEVQVLEKGADIEIPDELTEAWEHFSERQTVLIVEDNPEMRYYLREVLSGRVNLAEATNGKKALEWLSQNKADLVITDLMMPEMGGEEFVGYLKANDIYKKIPVITLTARADTEKRLDMLRLGIDDYIVKPFDASELRVRVYNLLTNLDERRKFEAAVTEEDDIPLQSKEAENFKDKITSFVLVRMKTIDVSVYDLAYELNLSERQLYRLAKSLTGCTPAQLIKEVRLQKAYELLLSGTIYKVDDLAKQVGFESPNYFSRQFYERFGKRPTEFL